MPALQYLRLADTLVCQGSPTIYGVLDWHDLDAASDTLAITDQEGLTFSFPRLDADGNVRPFASGARAGRIVLVAWDDGSFDEWRVRTVEDGRGSQGLVTITCVSLWNDLVERCDNSTGDGWLSDVTAGVRGFDYSLDAQDASSIWSTYVIPYCPSWVAAGTIDPTTTLTGLDFSRKTPGAVALAVRDALNALDVPCEVRLRRNGTTNYLLDLVTEVGASANTPVFHPNHGLLTLQRKLDATLQATRVLVTGQNAPDGTPGIWGRARWIGGAPSGNTITLADPNGASCPIAFDGQFVGWYLLRVQTGGTFHITASSASAGTVTLDRISSIASGEQFEFRVDEPGTNTRTTTTRYAVSSVVDSTHLALSSTPITVDGQYTDWYAKVWDSPSGGSVVTTVRISGSTAATSRIAVSSTSGVSTSDSVEFVQTDGDGEIPAYVDHPTYIQADPTGYGVKVAELTKQPTGVAQLCPNGWMRTWTTPSAMPDGWSTTGSPTIAQNTNTAYTRYGGQSLKAQTINTAILSTPVFYPPVPSDGGFLSLRAWVYFTALPATQDWTLKLYAAGPDGAASGSVLASVTIGGSSTTQTIVGTDTWIEMKIEGQPSTPGAAPYGYVATFSQIANGIFTVYIDCVEVYPFQTCPDTDFEFGDAHALCQSGNGYLGTNAAPLAYYTMQVTDLERAFPDEDPRLKLTLGANVRAVDPDYGIDTTVRLLRTDRDLLHPEQTTLTLANSPTLMSIALGKSALRQSAIVSAITTATASGAATPTTAKPYVDTSNPTTLPNDTEVQTNVGGAAVTTPTITNNDTQGASVSYTPADPATTPTTTVTVGTPPSRRKKLVLPSLF